MLLETKGLRFMKGGKEQKTVDRRNKSSAWRGRDGYGWDGMQLLRDRNPEEHVREVRTDNIIICNNEWMDSSTTKMSQDAVGDKKKALRHSRPCAEQLLVSLRKRRGVLRLLACEVTDSQEGTPGARLQQPIIQPGRYHIFSLPGAP
jgi:hypothetical protein